MYCIRIFLHTHKFSGPDSSLSQIVNVVSAFIQNKYKVKIGRTKPVMFILWLYFFPADFLESKVALSDHGVWSQELHN